MSKKLSIVLFFLILVCDDLVFSQTSFVKVNLPSANYIVSFSPKPFFESNDSAVYINILDRTNIQITVRDSVGKHRDLKFTTELYPFSMQTITIIEKNRKRLKLNNIRSEYYLVKKRCRTSTPQSVVERAIVDMMSIDHIGARRQEAKKFIRNHCLRFMQIKGIVMMFPSDKDRLDVAKYSYFFVRDYYNYFLLNQAFQSKSAYKQFEEFVKSVKKNFKF